MPYLDAAMQLASAFAPTAIGQNLPGANFVIDRLIGMDDGKGMDVIFYVRVATTAISGGSATVDFRLLGNASDPTFSSGNVVIIAANPGGLPIPVASLVAGYELRIKFPRVQPNQVNGPATLLRYYTLNVQIATATLTAGAFDAWLTNEGVQDNLTYPRGYTVL